MSIRTLLLLALLLVGLLPVGISVLISERIAVDALRDRITRQLELAANEQERLTETFIENQLLLVRRVGDRRIVGAVTAGLAQEGRPAALNRLTAILRSATNALPSFNAIHIVSTEGELLMSTDPQGKTLPERMDVEFLQASTQEPQVLFEIDEASETARMLAFLCAPVRTGDEVSAFLVAETLATEILPRREDAAAGEQILFAKEYTPGLAMVLDPLRADRIREINLDSSPARQSPIGMALRGREALITDGKSLQGEPVIAVTRSVANGNLVFVFQIPQEIAFAETTELRNAALRIFGVTTLVVVILASLIARNLSRPIRRLARTFTSMTAGQLDARAPVEGPREIQVLSRESNEMAEALSEATHNLEDKVAERTDQLHETQARYKDLFENAPVGYHELDLEGRLVHVNQTEHEMLGYQENEMVGRPVWEFIHEDVQDKILARLRGESSSADWTERQFKRADGSLLPVAIQNYPLRDRRGKIIGMRSTIHDITELKKARKEIENRTRALEKSNHELRATQMQLIQAEKMESIGTLAAGIAHEVKNPLARIQLGIDYLENSIDSQDENLPTVFDRMRKALERADTIVRELLDLSSNRQLDLRERNLNATVEMALLLVGHSLRSNQVEVRRELAEDLPLVRLDSAKIEQVLLNLLINATHAMEEQEERLLTVRTRTAVAEDLEHREGSRSGQDLRNGEDLVLLEIEDTGTGISEAMLEKLFDPFFTTKPTGKGTGLGLSVARKIIELHHGRIEMENRPEGGARATLKFRAETAALVS
ncbi:MAG: PAS domain S-box protein [Verrucomicrobiota bacterium]